ncbi:hypothetical protein RB195_014021 [Necator americanus]
MLDSSALDGIGWKVRGDFVPPESHERGPFFPRLRLIFDMVPMFIRAAIFTAKQWLQNEGVFINIFSQMKHNCYTGVPIGGIGSGSIGTDFRGAFNKFSIIPGIKEQSEDNIKANQFILTVHKAATSELVFQSLLSTADFSGTILSSWTSYIRSENTRYRGLFPRAWREIRIPEIGLTLICEQVSPVLPHNYEDTSFPVCNFHWTVINTSGTNYIVSLTFTFRNGTGNTKWEQEGKCSAELLQTSAGKGVKLDHTINSMPTTFVIAGEQMVDNEISCTTFNPSSKTGEYIWDSLKSSGTLSAEFSSDTELGIAVSSRFDLHSSSSKRSTFSLVWFMPVVHFGGKSRSHKRFYTRFFGNEEESVEKIISSAMRKGEEWRMEIEKWQQPVVDDKSLPEWYRSALFNELYYVVDGASMWFEYDSSWNDVEKIDPLTTKQLRRFGRFAWEYLMVNTYDVHFYASWAFIKNWPQLELSIQMDFCDQLNRTDMRTTTSLKDGQKMEVKTHSRIPHDLGNPLGEPWSETNAYILHDTAHWRDLNLKFVLICWRDYKLLVENNYDRESAAKVLSYFYKQSETIIRNALSEWDKDGDGMIENSGTADQTYDVWTMSGTSAYCGSLWLAALSSISCMAGELGRKGSQQFFEDVLTRAKQAFINKLWNGRYFKFDESSSNEGVIMADQLCGIWFLTMMQQNEIISGDQVLSALKMIHAYNVQQFASGKMGPVNGIYEDGSVDISSIQSEEVWTGTGYSLASFLIAKGKRKEGFDTARGIFETCWNRVGLQYQTPEAIYEEKYYRAIGYMRPLAIWAIHHALQMQTA